MRLTELFRLYGEFEQRGIRASTRLAQSSGNEWNFAFIGLTCEIERFSFEEIGVFRRVVEPPGEVELAAALSSPHLFGAIGRYSHQISHELAINRNGLVEDNRAFTMAWWVISALRVKTLAEFLVPVVADHSWSVVSAFKGQECRAQLLEDVPRARRVESAVVIKELDLVWVVENLAKFVEMLEVPRFRLAVDALTTHQHLVAPRMMVASLWSGIEALFGIQTELRFRLAITSASLLEPRGPKRIEQYRRIKRLYDGRSQAVHGGEIDEATLLNHVIEARSLLSRLICGMVDVGRVLSDGDFEQRLLE